MIFLAEVGKKKLILESISIDQASKILSDIFKDKTIKLSEGSIGPGIRFKIGSSVIYSLTKIKGSMISFISETNTSGRIDISMLPIELA